MPYIRTTKPTKSDKYYIRQASKGYSTCIKGKPTDKDCDVLANCVGFADGFFNEYVGLGYEKYHLNCNAENFVERAIASGLSVVKNPVPGGVLVWQKGATLKASDGAGHVAGCTWVDNVDNPTQIKTSESGYGSKAFWTATRTNKNGKWGAGSGYSYRGCIVPPNYVKPTPAPIPTPEPTPAPTPKPEWPKSHTIQKGETLSGIAKKYYGSGDSTHYNFIAKANGISNPNKISVGKVLTIPEYKNESVSYKTHTVRKGENLSVIAKKYNTTWKKIYEDNKSVIGSNPNLVKPGQVLVIK